MQEPDPGKLLIIADPSLKDTQGHHFALSVIVTRAALCKNMRVSWFTHQDFAANAIAGTTVHRVFSSSVYDSHIIGDEGEQGSDAGIPDDCAQEKRRAAIRTAAEELREGFRETYPCAGDHILFHTADSSTYQTVLELVSSKRPTPLPKIHLCTPYDDQVIPNKDPERSVDSMVRDLRLLGHLNRTIFLYAENELLAEFWRQRWDADVQALNLPPPYAELPPAHRDGASLNIAYLGAAREEKGFLLLPEIIERLYPHYKKTKAFRFTIQCSPQIIGYLPSIKESIAALAKFPPEYVELRQKHQTPEMYAECLSGADIVLVCYDPERYRVRSTGIAVESVSMGKPIVTFPGTFPAHLAGDSAILGTGAIGLADALRGALDEYGRIEQQARIRAAEYRACHTPNGYIDYLVSRVDRGPGYRPANDSRTNRRRKSGLADLNLTGVEDPQERTRILRDGLLRLRHHCGMQGEHQESDFAFDAPLLVAPTQNTPARIDKLLPERSLESAEAALPDEHGDIPTFYILTPCFNAAAHIDETIAGVLCQSGRFNIRYHVQDGGSTDGTATKLAAWKERLDMGTFPTFCETVDFTYASHPDRGLYDAINIGFSVMAIPPTAFMGWINADDLLEHNALASVRKAALDIGTDLAWIGQAATVVDEGGARIGGHSSLYPRQAIRDGICDSIHWHTLQQEGSFWRKSLWDRVGGIDTGFTFAADWDLWRRMAEFREVALVPWPLASFRKREGQLSTVDGGERYRAEIDSAIPRLQRQSALERLAITGAPNIHCDLVDSALEREHYRLQQTPLTGRIPDIAQRIFANPPIRHLTGSETGAPLIAETSPTSGSLLGSPFISALYASTPTWSQTLLNQIKQRLLLPLREHTRPLRMRLAIRRSGLFFTDYYLESHPEIAQGRRHAIAHFIQTGSHQGFNPNPLFDTAWYLSRNPELLATDINPLYHYIRQGALQKQDPSPSFSTQKYLQVFPEVAESTESPLAHYFRSGVFRNPTAPYDRP